MPRLLLVCLCAALTVGCSANKSMYGVRPLFHPGPAEYQRQDDAYWDPYPKNDLNDPVLNDLRPRDFDKSMSEVKRAQTTPHDAGARNSFDYTPIADSLR
jgi:hypothetical protein